MGGGGRWGAEGGYTIHWNRKAAIVCYKKGHSLHICQAEMVVSSSFTLSVALLVCPSGSMHPMDLQGHKYDVEVNLAICSCVIGVSAWIVLECGFHVKEKLNFANPVTNL